LQQVANFCTILIALLITYFIFPSCLTPFLASIEIEKWNLTTKMS